MVIRTVLLGAVLAVCLSGLSYAEGDPARGEKIYKKCLACHLVTASDKKRVGPHLAIIFGRKAGKLAGFKYSRAMKKADIVWDETSIDAFITKPKTFLKGNKMTFAGLKKPQDRADVIAYLKAVTK